MKRWSIKIKVGVYAAIVTIAALIAGGGVMMGTLYFYQISELDELLSEQANELVWDLKNFRDSPKDPREPLREEFIPVPLRTNYLVVEGPEGQIVYQSSNLHGSLLQGDVGKCQTMKLFDDKCRVGAWRVGDYVVRIGERLDFIQRFMKELGIGILASLPAVGIVVFFGGMWLGRRTIAPVAEISAAAERISASNPSERLPMPPTHDEIAKLTEVVNRSFDRLQTSYELATRFSADASHQLKTPVAILRAGLDQLSRASDLTDSQADELAMLRQQTRRLTSLIEDLLLLAQADAGRVMLEKRRIDLIDLIRGAWDDLQVQVASKKILIKGQLPDSLPVLADSRLLAMVFHNLTENAGKYTPDGGEIHIEATRVGADVRVAFRNTDHEISEVDDELIFERFRRGSDTGGNVRGHGLGLNIARELLRAHGGDVRLKRPEQGMIEFEVRFPAGV